MMDGPVQEALVVQKSEQSHFGRNNMRDCIVSVELTRPISLYCRQSYLHPDCFHSSSTIPPQNDSLNLNL